ncbi:MAG: oxygen-independent coproporphyrinogen III oxidase [Rhizobiaceae bacterium]
MDKTAIERLSASVPRYTSYPTAPHFSADVGPDGYARWLAAVPMDAGISLYVHVPYCDRLCWFCACATKQTRRYEPVSRYLRSLEAEIATISGHLAGRGRVTALHFGGGSPTMLKADDIVALADTLKRHFIFAGDAEISVEIDPNDMDGDRHRALAEIGMTRASLGVQDFDDRVQRAINRIQTFDQTREVVEAVRAAGAASVNIDLLYGLPLQSVASVEATLAKVVTLSPDRIALFGYAHVPWMKKHQTMIDEAALPDIAERFAQAGRAAGLLREAGYQAVGIDHFARPDDSMARAAREGRLKRNFQGYTTDGADVMIGLGASSIGRLPQGYVQNMPATGGYQRMVDEGGLATVRGAELSEEDRMRARIIEQLMCSFAFSASGLVAEFGDRAMPLVAEARRMAVTDREALVKATADGFTITAAGRPFTRLIASRFDSYFGNGPARHSTAV